MSPANQKLLNLVVCLFTFYMYVCWCIMPSSLQWSTPLAQSEQISALVPEDKVLFGLMACQRPIIKTIHELEKIYNRADTRTIAREVSVDMSVWTCLWYLTSSIVLERHLWPDLQLLVSAN